MSSALSGPRNMVVRNALRAFALHASRGQSSTTEVVCGGTKYSRQAQPAMITPRPFRSANPLRPRAAQSITTFCHRHSPSHLVTPSTTMDLDLVFLDPKTITDAQIKEVTEALSKAFVDFNTAVGAPKEVVDEEFGHPEITPIAVEGICKGYEGFAVVSHDGGGDGKIVGVSFVDVHGTGSKKVATLGPVSSLVPGGGRKTFVAACEHAEKLGFSTLVLTVVASNSRSFALYSKIGFQARHVCQYVGGFLSEETLSSPPPASTDGSGVTLTPMVTADVEECADLFLAAHGKDCGWDRTADIAGALASDFPFPKLVARDADGKVVGYSTGFFIIGHTVATSNEVFITMFREASRLHKQEELPSPRFHCPVEFPGLLSWVLSQKGLKVFRAMIIMSKGPFEHTPWSDDAGHVVAPSSIGY